MGLQNKMKIGVNLEITWNENENGNSLLVGNESTDCTAAHPEVLELGGDVLAADGRRCVDSGVDDPLEPQSADDGRRRRGRRQQLDGAGARSVCRRRSHRQVAT